MSTNTSNKSTDFSAIGYQILQQQVLDGLTSITEAVIDWTPGLNIQGTAVLIRPIADQEFGLLNNVAAHVGVLINDEVHHYNGHDIYTDFLKKSVSPADFFGSGPGSVVILHPNSLIEERFLALKEAIDKRSIGIFNQKFGYKILEKYDPILSNCECVVRSLVAGDDLSHQVAYLYHSLELLTGKVFEKPPPLSLRRDLLGMTLQLIKSQLSPDDSLALSVINSLIQGIPLYLN